MKPPRATKAPPGLFRLGEFALSSGQHSRFKIDCDVLSDTDLECLAALIVELVPAFGAVEGVPRGGLRLAEKLSGYIEPGNHNLLIVDDVLTTGASMERHRAFRPAYGAVIFARGPLLPWTTAVFRMVKPRNATRTGSHNVGERAP